MEVGLVNFKKLFPDKKVSQKRVLDFFDKKGFYIVLALCITIIGVTAALVASHNMSLTRGLGEEEIISPEMASNISTDEEQISADFELEQSDIGSAAKVAAKPIVDEKKLSPATGSPKPAESNKKTDEKKEEIKESEDKSKTKTAEPKGTKDSTDTGKAKKSEGAKTEEIQSFTRPVFGEITYEFAYDKLIYSKTLDEWRNHSGIDLKADRGTPIKVVADGIVLDIKNDPRLGIMIVVEHTKSIKTVYANLANGDMVTPNQKVKQGEVIGAVGNTAKFEAAEPPHLHFEVLKDNKPVNPQSYLPNADTGKEKDN